MTKKITLLDYGMANMLNVARAFEYCGATVEVVDDARSVAATDRLVVPGVGAFEHAMRELRGRGFDDAIRSYIATERPFFGICVGMQMLFDASEEFGEHEGLHIFPGRVMAVPSSTTADERLRVPHIGWNHLVAPMSGRGWQATLLEPFIGQAPAFYFVHSFAAKPERAEDELVDCLYGGHRLCAAVQRDNVVATQFHPERSGKAGLRLVEEFLTW